MSSSISIKNAGNVHVIEIDESTTGLDLKMRIQALTQIPVGRQKILVKGGKLNDDAKISTLRILAKAPIMVLGTPDKDLPLPKPTQQVFLEDLNENQLVKVSHDPSGLVNLGNTCYLNSSLQAIYAMSDVTKLIEQSSESHDPLVTSLKSIFSSMAKKQTKVNPALFLMQFRKLYPQFAEQERGFYKQQDAEEAFSQLLNALSSTTGVDDLLRVDFKVVTKCLALPAKDLKVEFESSTKLNCHIDIKTNFLRDGIINSLTDKVQKFNEELQADTEYEAVKTITRLPKYLTIHFVRFFWRRDTQKKSKILRKVQFPFELDVAEMLDESIRFEKVSVRDLLRKLEKDHTELLRDYKRTKRDSSLSPQEQEEENELKLASIRSKFADDFSDVLPRGYDLELTKENPSSVYELQTVITHQGSSADSGHYQAFVRNESDLNGEEWYKFNDDKVSLVNREKIEQLAGGGESDSALILVYKAKGL